MPTLEQIKQKAKDEALREIRDKYHLIEKDKSINYSSGDKLMEIIMQVIHEQFHISPEQLKSKNRKQPITECRHYFIYVTRKLSGNAVSLQRVTSKINRDHSTGVFAERKLKTMMDIYDTVKNDIDKIMGITKERLDVNFKPNEQIN